MQREKPRPSLPLLAASKHPRSADRQTQSSLHCTLPAHLRDVLLLRLLLRLPTLELMQLQLRQLLQLLNLCWLQRPKRCPVSSTILACS